MQAGREESGEREKMVERDRAGQLVVLRLTPYVPTRGKMSGTACTVLKHHTGFMSVLFFCSPGL